MEEYEFDKTKKVIGADSMSSRDRKAMLGKFKDAGGQVVDDRAVKKEEGGSGRGGRGGRGAGGGGVDTRLPSQIARDKNRAQQERLAAQRREMDREEKDATSLFARIGLKLKCRFAGVTPYGRDMVTPKFLSLLNLDAKRAIMECQILGNDLFMNNKKTAQAIVKELDEKNPLLVELIERASKLYNRQELGELCGGYTPQNQMSQPLDALRAPIFSLTRKLHYLKPFAETYLVAADRAIDIQQREEKKQSGLYSAKKKKIRQEWKVLMHTIYPGLVLLVQRAEMKNADSTSRLFENMLGIVDEDRIGHRNAGDPVGGAEESKTKEEKKEEDKGEGEDGEEEGEGGEEENKEERELSKELQYGYRLMKILPADALRRKHDPKNENKELQLQDKVFLSYLLLREFEEEYSFILTTPQIKLNASYEGGVKQDYKQKLTDIFEELRRPSEAFRMYRDDAIEHLNALKESSSAQNYVQHAKRVSSLEGKRGGKGREVRLQIVDVMQKIVPIFQILIKDMRGPNEIVANKDEPIKFQMERDLRKRLNGKAVKDCIMQAYCYCIALADRIENGDLFGGVIDMSDEAFEAAFDASVLQ